MKPSTEYCKTCKLIQIYREHVHIFTGNSYLIFFLRKYRNFGQNIHFVQMWQFKINYMYPIITDNKSIMIFCPIAPSLMHGIVIHYVPRKLRQLIGTHDLRAGSDPYHATPAVTQGLGFVVVSAFSVI